MRDKKYKGDWMEEDKRKHFDTLYISIKSLKIEIKNDFPDFPQEYLDGLEKLSFTCGYFKGKNE